MATTKRLTVTEKRLTITGYKFTAGAHFPNKIAPAVGKRLAELTEEKGEGLVAADVVEDARGLHSPLHPLFEWDDTIAAIEYRLEQARRLLRSIQIEYVDSGGSSGEMRAYSVVTQEETVHYMPMVSILKDAGLRAQVLAAAERELEAFKRKYSGLEELFGVITAATKFLMRRRRKARA